MTPTPDVNSTATDSSTVATLEVPQSGPAYDNWRKTGQITPKEDSATSKETSADAESGSTAPASEAGKSKEPTAAKPRGNAETRLSELLADLKTAGLSPAELKTYKREQVQRQEAATPKVEAPKVEQPKVTNSDKPARPVFGDKDGESWNDFQTRDSAWVEQMGDYAVTKYKRQQAEEAQQRELKTQVDAAQGRYGDEAGATISTAIDSLVAADIPGAVKSIINDSPVLIDLAYVMGSKPAELAEFLALAKSNPSAAIRRVVLMEKLVQEELGKASATSETTAQRDESGKFTKQAPEKKTTAAPPIGTEVSGRGSAPGDPIESAAKAGDVTAYFEAANRRDLERRRGR